jgi:lactoylglutathione lyase
MQRIDVMMVYVEDQERMLDFFVNTLGFEKATDGEMWPGARWLEVKPPGAETGLGLLKASDFNLPPSNDYAGTFACADLEAMRQRLADAGVRVTDISNEHWGSYFQATDPEGRDLMINGRA